MGTIIQRERFILIKVLAGKDARVEVSGNALKLSPRILIEGDEMNITYDVLTDASEGVEAAIEGALALEEE